MTPSESTAPDPIELDYAASDLEPNPEGEGGDDPGPMFIGTDPPSLGALLLRALEPVALAGAITFVVGRIFATRLDAGANAIARVGWATFGSDYFSVFGLDLRAPVIWLAYTLLVLLAAWTVEKATGRVWLSGFVMVAVGALPFLLQADPVPSLLRALDALPLTYADAADLAVNFPTQWLWATAASANAWIAVRKGSRAVLAVAFLFAALGAWELAAAREPMLVDYVTRVFTEANGGAEMTERVRGALIEAVKANEIWLLLRALPDVLVFLAPGWAAARAS